MHEISVKRRNDTLFYGAGEISVGVYDALTARIAERAGFKSFFITGAGLTNTKLGLPDMGFLSFKELLDTVFAIRDAVECDIAVDADTGFGNPVNVRRTVRELERAGANTIIIEDQVSPKRCGHFVGKAVISKEDMVQKIKAAVDARSEATTLIQARTDARAVEGLDGALDRARAYLEAGADMLFVEAPISLDELARIPKEVPGIHVCNMVIGGKTPILEREQLAGLGFAVIGYANAGLQAAVPAIDAVYRHLLTNGSIAGFEGAMMLFNDRQELLNKQFYDALDERYSS